MGDMMRTNKKAKLVDGFAVESLKDMKVLKLDTDDGKFKYVDGVYIKYTSNGTQWDIIKLPREHAKRLAISILEVL